MASNDLPSGFICLRVCSHCFYEERVAEITFDECSVDKNYDCIIGEKAAIPSRTIRPILNRLS